MSKWQLDRGSKSGVGYNMGWVIGLLGGLGLVLAACTPVLESDLNPDPTPQTVAVMTPETQIQETSMVEETPEVEPDFTDPDRPARPTSDVPPGLERVPTEASTPVVGEVPDALLSSIVGDLVDRLGVAPGAVAVVRAEAVVWRDGSLGCPQPGVFYTQALVDGYWVVLRVAGVDYDYRASTSGYFALCEKPGPLPPELPGGGVGAPKE